MEIGRSIRDSMGRGLNAISMDKLRSELCRSVHNQTYITVWSLVSESLNSMQWR